MKLLFWNIGYAPGLDGSLKDYTLNAHRFLRLSEKQQKVVLDEVAHVIEQESPDVALYAEISLGSGRNQKFDQHKYLLSQFKGIKAEAAASKYRDVYMDKLPLHTGNANGFISWQDCKVEEVHFSVGRKSLVYVIEVNGITILMVHMGLQRKTRAVQFRELAELVNALKGPVVVCGDMNIFGGVEELQELQALTGLELPTDIPFTYPAFSPKQTLDLCLVRDCAKVHLSALSSKVSDHAPILIEIE